MRNLFVAVSTLLLVGCGGGGGAGNSSAPETPEPVSTPLRLVGEIQGSGASSPLDGQLVRVRGVVTGDFQDNDANTASSLGGFYITGVPDASLQTSDGLFVFDGSTPAVDVNVGDSVEITGTVSEFFGETQLAADTIAIVGSGSIEAALLLPPTATTTNSDGRPVADLEQFEGMLVRIPEALTVSETFDLDRYGELLLTRGGRAITYTNTSAPSVDGFNDYQAELALRSLILDDGRQESGLRPVRYLNPAEAVRVGDEVSNLTGVLRYSRGAGGSGQQGWRLEPTADPVFTRANPRTAAPNPGGSLRIAAINVLNLFTTLDDSGRVCGPGGSNSCRGADTAEEFNRQLAKITTALLAIDADIVGLVEIENNESASLEALVAALASNGADYNFVNTGFIGTDSIKVGFLYKPATVSEVGDFAVLDQSVDSRFIDTKSRPVLAQTFEELASGGRLTVAVNHLKSKGSDCDELGDPDLGDGAGNCNVTRTRAAEAMADWLASDPTGSDDTDVLIVGDLNAYYQEPPVEAIVAAGYLNLIEEREGSESYSFVFRGQSGALDHAFATPSLDAQVSGAVKWPISADESRLLDYNTEGDRDPAWFDASTPWRASDHDPIIIGLQLLP